MAGEVSASSLESLVAHWGRLASALDEAAAVVAEIEERYGNQQGRLARGATRDAVFGVLATIKVIDGITDRRLLPLLSDVLVPRGSPEPDWRNLIGMRDILAHQMWSVDPEIVWRTATDEFPVIADIVGRVFINAGVVTLAASSASSSADVVAVLDSGPTALALRQGRAVVFAEATRGFGVLAATRSGIDLRWAEAG